MNSKRSKFLLYLLPVYLGFSVASTISAQQVPAAVQERVAAVKQTLQTSAEALKKLEWVETTTVTEKGKQKARIMNKCYYGLDGKVQKVPVLPPGEDKNEKLQNYVEDAVALLHKYVPPDPTLIQRCVDRGTISIKLLDPGRTVGLVFNDYILTGDSLTLTVDLTKNTVTNASVATYLDEPKNSMTLQFDFGSLLDGTTYPANVTLTAPSKHLQVAVEYSGFREPTR